jgi:hypothetical protein
MWLKEAHVLFLSHVKVSVLCNGGKGVMDCIMGSSAFIVISVV